MQLYERLRDSEAKAGAVIALGQLAFDLFERTTEAGEGSLRNADPCIRDHHHHFAANDPASDHDASAIGREFYCVGEQVDENLLHRAAISHDRNGAVDPAVERQLFAIAPA